MNATKTEKLTKEQKQERCTMACKSYETKICTSDESNSDGKSGKNKAGGKQRNLLMLQESGGSAAAGLRSESRLASVE